MPKMIDVEVCYASLTEQYLLSVSVSENATVKEAILSSGVLNRFAELQLEAMVVGIFSRKCSLDTVLKAGDRVEIYRPLTIDPKTARRLRAKK
jgi:hypothetical protein